MKKYIVFILGFVLCYIVFHIISGLFLTALYTPDFSSTNHNGSQAIAYRQNPMIAYFGIIVAATLAYFMAKKVSKRSNK